MAAQLEGIQLPDGGFGSRLSLRNTAAALGGLNGGKAKMPVAMVGPNSLGHLSPWINDLIQRALKRMIVMTKALASTVLDMSGRLVGCAILVDEEEDLIHILQGLILTAAVAVAYNPQILVAIVGGATLAMPPPMWLLLAVFVSYWLLTQIIQQKCSSR